MCIRDRDQDAQFAKIQKDLGDSVHWIDVSKAMKKHKNEEIYYHTDHHLSLIHIWNQIKRPAVKWVKGKYPTKENEVMASVDALKECGLENLEIGDSFQMKYADKNGSYTKEFRISGMLSLIHI